MAENISRSTCECFSLSWLVKGHAGRQSEMCEVFEIIIRMEIGWGWMEESPSSLITHMCCCWHQWSLHYGGTLGQSSQFLVKALWIFFPFWNVVFYLMTYLSLIVTWFAFGPIFILLFGRDRKDQFSSPSRRSIIKCLNMLVINNVLTLLLRLLAAAWQDSWSYTMCRYFGRDAENDGVVMRKEMKHEVRCVWVQWSEKKELGLSITDWRRDG